MKKYVKMILAASLLYGCTNGNIAAVDNRANIDNSAKPAVVKNNSAANGQSIFAVSDTFQTQNKRNLLLSSLSGKPTVIGMIFTRCGAACPKITADMKNIGEKLNANREKVNFVLVSFDTERDNAGQLQMFANEMGLDKDWLLLHGSEEAVRTLSVLLNVQYEKDAEGNFSHSNVISVLDKNGVLAFQKEGLDPDQKEMTGKIEELLK